MKTNLVKMQVQQINHNGHSPLCTNKSEERIKIATEILVITSAEYCYVYL